MPQRGLRAGAALAHHEGPTLVTDFPKADPSHLYRLASVRLLRLAKEMGKRWEIPLLLLRSRQAKGREVRANNRSKSDDGAGGLPVHQLTRHCRTVLSVHPFLFLPTHLPRFLVF